MDYCTCDTPHLSVPGNIDTAKCVYCNKPPLGVFLRNNPHHEWSEEWLEWNSDHDIDNNKLNKEEK